MRTAGDEGGRRGSAPNPAKGYALGTHYLTALCAVKRESKMQKKWETVDEDKVSGFHVMR